MRPAIKPIRIAISFAMLLAGAACPALSQTGNAKGVSVRLTVLDPAHRRVAEASVHVTGKTPAETASGVTDSSGTTTLTLPTGSYTVIAAATGLSTTSPQTLVVGTTPTSATIQLEISTVQTSLQVSGEVAPRLAQQNVSPADLALTPSPDLAEDLTLTPGVEAVHRGADNEDPVITGLRQTQIAMTVDGTRTFAAGPARMDSEISQVDPGNVSNVTVVEGPYALTQGAGALSAIEVQTDPVPFYQNWTWGGKSALGYGFNSSDRYARTTVFGADSRFGIQVYGTGGKGNNYEAGSHGGIEQSVPARYGDYQGGGKFRLGITDNQELDFAGSYDDQTGIDYPGALLNAVLLLTRSWNGEYYIKQPNHWIDQFHFQLYLNKKGHRMTNAGKPTAMDNPLRTPPFALNISLPTISNTWGGAANMNFHESSHLRFNAGVDFYNLDQNAQRFISRASTGALLFDDTVWPDATVEDQGYYFSATDQWERATVAATVRLDTVEAKARTPSAFFLANAPGPLSTREVNPNFSLLGNYHLFHGTSVSLGFGRAVRTASVLERYSDRFPSTVFQTAAEFMGDPGIKPEVSYQTNLGLNVQLSYLNFRGGLFYRRLDDEITVALDPGIPKELPLDPTGVYRYLNGDHADYRGFNYVLIVPVTQTLEFRTQGAYTLADEIGASVPLVGVNEPLFGIPPLDLRHSLKYTFGKRFWGQVTLRNAFAQNRVSYTRFEVPTPGFSTLDFAVGGEVYAKTTLYAGVLNVTNKYYYEHINSFNPYTSMPVPEPGRNVYIGLDYQF